MRGREGNGGVGHHRTMSAITQKLELSDHHNLGHFDSLSNASFKEVMSLAKPLIINQ